MATPEESAMPQSMSLSVYRGDCYTWSFTFWSDPDATVPYDLSDAVAKVEFRTKPGSPVLATPECTVVAPNTVEVFLSAEQSQALVPGKSVWDLQVTFSDGCVKTLVAGGVTVTADVTDSGLVTA